MQKTQNTQKWGKEMDAKEHLGTYQRFLKLGKYSLIIAAVVLLALLVFVYD
ncbi:MAG: aa3-type cytochrome c oxidase subunit IV [Parvibaculales bacterium]